MFSNDDVQTMSLFVSFQEKDSTTLYMYGAHLSIVNTVEVHSPRTLPAVSPGLFQAQFR